jgi:hypothetical protein
MQSNYNLKYNKYKKKYLNLQNKQIGEMIGGSSFKPGGDSSFKPGGGSAVPPGGGSSAVAADATSNEKNTTIFHFCRHAESCSNKKLELKSSQDPNTKESGGGSSKSKLGYVTELVGKATELVEKATEVAVNTAVLGVNTAVQKTSHPPLSELGCLQASYLS